MKAALVTRCCLYRYATQMGHSFGMNGCIFAGDVWWGTLSKFHRHHSRGCVPSLFIPITGFFMGAQSCGANAGTGAATGLVTATVAEAMD
jgi:hypothetical protein